jgi:integrase
MDAVSPSPSAGRGKSERWPKVVKAGSVGVTVYRMRHATARTGWTYVVAWVTPAGRQRRKFTDAGAALDEARLKADQLHAGRVEGAEMSRGDRDELQAARALAKDVPVVAALKEWAEARALCAGQLVPAAKLWRDTHGTTSRRTSVPEAVDAFLAAKKRSGVAVASSYDQTLPRLKEAFTGPMESVTARALTAWIYDTFAQPLPEGEGKPGEKRAHPSTVNTHRKRLVALWRWARKEGYLPALAQTEAERMDRAREEATEIGIIDARTFARILALIRDRHADYLALTVLAGFCGLRRSELHAQTWADVNLARAFVRVTAAKRNTPSKRLVPLAPAAVEWLLSCKHANAKDALVSPPWGVDLVRKFVREAGIDCPENAFRHSFISARVAQTGDVAATSLEAGNSPAIIFKHYRELMAKEDGAAWFALTPAAVAGQSNVIPLKQRASA